MDFKSMKLFNFNNDDIYTDTSNYIGPWTTHKKHINDINKRLNSIVYDDGWNYTPEKTVSVEFGKVY